MRGFTLIEILVVIAITAVIGLIALVNLQGFGTDQNLKNQALDLVNILKNAQTNASTSLKCNGNLPISWQTKLSQSGNKIVIDTKCQYKNDQGVQPPITVSSKTLSESVLLDSINGKATCVSSDLSADPLTLAFTPLTGQINFSAFGDCFSTSNEITITLKNSKNQSVMTSVVVNKGGGIYVK